MDLDDHEGTIEGKEYCDDLEDEIQRVQRLSADPLPFTPRTLPLAGRIKVIVYCLPLGG